MMCNEGIKLSLLVLLLGVGINLLGAPSTCSRAGIIAIGMELFFNLCTFTIAFVSFKKCFRCNIKYVILLNKCYVALEGKPQSHENKYIIIFILLRKCDLLLILPFYLEKLF
ncbi:hypothetical protein ACJX0J_019957 [Zea mays]